MVLGKLQHAAAEHVVDVDESLPADVDTAAIERVGIVAYLLDQSVGIPRTKYRVGLDSIVGLLPVAGDTAAAILSLYIVLEAARLGARKRTLLRMLFNVGVDLVVGSVPLVGDVFDALWNANTKNVDLLVADLSAP